ncbi:hypothetical protein Tco_0309806, partial [Tanacetum coccineum]
MSPGASRIVKHDAVDAAIVGMLDKSEK